MLSGVQITSAEDAALGKVITFVIACASTHHSEAIPTSNGSGTVAEKMSR
jgi:hypothetical protein